MHLKRPTATAWIVHALAKNATGYFFGHLTPVHAQAIH